MIDLKTNMLNVAKLEEKENVNLEDENKRLAEKIKQLLEHQAKVNTTSKEQSYC